MRKKLTDAAAVIGTDKADQVKSDDAGTAKIRRTLHLPLELDETLDAMHYEANNEKKKREKRRLSFSDFVNTLLEEAIQARKKGTK